MKKLKESILNVATKCGSRNIRIASNDASEAITSGTIFCVAVVTRYCDNYIYGIGIPALLAVGA